MKSVVNKVVGTLLLVALAGSVVLAKTNLRTVSFSSDLKVNGTLVKKGEYDASFDEKTGELSLEKHGKVVAKTSARLEMRDRKATRTEVQTNREGMDEILVGIAFGGSNQNVVVNQGGMQAGDK
jgi:hypothetical protein